MERLKAIKDQLIAQVQGQMGDLKCVDTEELGEVIDMIYDLSKSIYYCTVVKAMEEGKEDERRSSNSYYYTEKYYPMPSYEDGRDYDYFRNGRMYYLGGQNGNGSLSSSNSGNSTSGDSRSYYEEQYPISLGRDSREGKSGMRRMMYMESKETHQDTIKKVQDLENYMKELSSDIVEMLADASPEEKAIVQKKMNTLVSKIQNV